MNSQINQLIKINTEIILASASPRRKFLLSLLGIPFSTTSVEIDEDNYESTEPHKIVCELAERKAIKASKTLQNELIITADTLVFLDHLILSKPKDPDDAFRILKTLSNRTHQVYTGFTLLIQNKGIKITDYEKTNVTFRNLQDDEIYAYIQSGSPLDKAGAYGIQDDFGAVFVERIEGDYYNVVGLPLCKLYNHLRWVSSNL